MKFLLIAAFLSLAAAACRDEERIYKYETQVASGLIPNSPLRSGLKLYAQAHMQFKCGQPEVKVQLRNVVLYKIDQPLVQIKGDFRTIPNEFLKEWIGAEAGKIVEAAQIPFAFQYVEGQVTGLSFDDKDFTIDVKKGFVSLFEVNLKKRLLLEDEPFRASKAIESEHTSEYTVFERSTAGDCATKYFVHPMTVGSKAVMEVNKVRDYSRCLNAPGYSKSPFMEGIEMPDSLKANPLVRSSNIRYSIKGNVEDFIITSAIGEERIIFSPYYAPKDTEEVRTTINQTLVLYGSKRLSEATPIRDVKMSATNKAYHAAQHLKMTIPNSDPKLQDQMPDVIKMSPLSTFRAYPVEKIVSQLMEVAENVQEITSQESVVHMRVVTEMLRTASYADLKQISLELTSPHPRPQTPIHKLAEKVMWTALNHVHTDAAVHFLLDECMTVSSLIQVSSCPWTLTQLVLTATPTPEIITKITEMLKTSVAETPLMKMKLYLTLGSFAYKMNFVNAKRLKELNVAEAMLTPLTKESNDVARNIVTKKLAVITKQKTSIHKISMETSKTVMKIFTDLLEKDNEQDTILALKAIRNSGLRAAVPVLKKFLLDEKFRKRPDFRVLAVLAHCRLADQPIAREEAKNFLVDLLMHTTESNEIRTAAFHVLMNLKPDLPLMEMIAVKMQSEKDLHLTSYVTSYLQSYANSTFAPVMPFSKNATVALKSAPGYTTGIDHAFYTFGGYYNEKHRMGASFELASHGSMDRFMSFDFGLNTVLFGRKATPFSINVATQGMGSLINNMFGAKGIKSLSTLMNLVQSSSGSINPKQFIKQIMDGVNMLPREMKSFNGQVQLNMFGHEVRYFNSIEDIVQFFLPGDKLKFNMAADSIQTALPLDIKTTMYLMDAKLTMPTESGFPVSLQTQITSSMKVNGDVKVKAALPTQMKGVSMFQMLPKKADIGVNVNKKVVLGVYASMGLDCFSIKPTAGFRGIIKVVEPMNTKATVDFASGIVTKEYTIPQQAEPLIETVFEPISEVLIISSTPNVPTVEYTSRPIYASANERITPVAVTLPMPYFGYSLKMIGQSPVQSFYPIPASPLRGRSEMKLSIVPNADAPSVVTIKTKLVTMWNARTTEALKVSAADDSSIQVDPIDVTKPITMPMVMKKLLQKAGGKILPKAVNPWDIAVVVTVDASSGAVPRQMQAEYFTHQTDSVNHQHFRMLRLWTSAIPGWADKQWQLIGEFNVTSPTKVYTPEDIYSINWQKQLAFDLEYHTDSPMESAKVVPKSLCFRACSAGEVCTFFMNIYTCRPIQVVRSIMNKTMGSISEHLVQPAMNNYIPAGRVLDSLMPEMYFSKKMTAPVSKHTLSVFSKVQEELQIIVDPYFTNRNVIVMELVNQLIEAQQGKINYLKNIADSAKQMNVDDFAYAQWIVMKNADSLMMLKDIVAKYKATGAITNIDAIKPRIAESSKLMVTLIKIVQKILMHNPLSYKVSTPGVVEPQIQVIEPLNKMAAIHSIEDLKITGVATHEHVISAFKILCVKQIKEIENIIENNVRKGHKVDASPMLALMRESEGVIRHYDSHIKTKFLPVQPVSSFITLATVQNEFLVKLWQSYIEMQVVNGAINIPAAEKKPILDAGLLTKRVGCCLALRVSQNNKAFKLSLIMEDQEDATMREMREKLYIVQRNVMTEAHIFADFGSGLKGFANKEVEVNNVLKKIDENIVLIVETVQKMQQKLNINKPNIHMISTVVQAIENVHSFTSMYREKLGEDDCSKQWCRITFTKMENRIGMLSELLGCRGIDCRITITKTAKGNDKMLKSPYDVVDCNNQWCRVTVSMISRNPMMNAVAEEDCVPPFCRIMSTSTDTVSSELLKEQIYYNELLDDMKSGILKTKTPAERDALLSSFKRRVERFNNGIRKAITSSATAGPTRKFHWKPFIISELIDIILSQVTVINYVQQHIVEEPSAFRSVPTASSEWSTFKDEVNSVKEIVEEHGLKINKLSDEDCVDPWCRITSTDEQMKVALKKEKTYYNALLHDLKSGNLKTQSAEARSVILANFRQKVESFNRQLRNARNSAPTRKFHWGSFVIGEIIDIIFKQGDIIDMLQTHIRSAPKASGSTDITASMWSELQEEVFYGKDAALKINDLSEEACTQPWCRITSTSEEMASALGPEKNFYDKMLRDLESGILKTLSPADRDNLLLTIRRKVELFSHSLRNTLNSAPTRKFNWKKFIIQEIIGIIASQGDIIDIIQMNVRQAPKEFGSASKWSVLKEDVISTKEVVQTHKVFAILINLNTETNELSACTEDWCRLTSTNQEVENNLIKKAMFYDDLLHNITYGILKTQSPTERNAILSIFKKDVESFSKTVSDIISSGTSRKFHWQSFIIKQIIDIILQQETVIYNLQTSIREEPSAFRGVDISVAMLREKVEMAKQIAVKYASKIGGLSEEGCLEPWCRITATIEDRRSELLNKKRFYSGLLKTILSGGLKTWSHVEQETLLSNIRANAKAFSSILSKTLGMGAVRKFHWQSFVIGEIIDIIFKQEEMVDILHTTAREDPSEFRGVGITDSLWNDTLDDVSVAKEAALQVKAQSPESCTEPWCRITSTLAEMNGALEKEQKYYDETLNTLESGILKTMSPVELNTLLTTFRQKTEEFSHSIRNTVMMSHPKTRGFWGKIAKTIVKIVVSQIDITDIIQMNVQTTPRVFGSATKWAALKAELVGTKEIVEKHLMYTSLITSTELEDTLEKEQTYCDETLVQLKAGILTTMSPEERDTLLKAFRIRTEVFSHFIRDTVIIHPKTRGFWGKIAKTIVKVVVSQIGITDIIQMNVQDTQRAIGSAIEWAVLKAELVRTKEIVEHNSGNTILISSTDAELEAKLVEEQKYCNSTLITLNAGIMTMSPAEHDGLLTTFRQRSNDFSNYIRNKFTSHPTTRGFWGKFTKTIVKVIISQVDILDMLQTNIRSAPQLEMDGLRGELVKTKEIVEEHLVINDLEMEVTKEEKYCTETLSLLHSGVLGYMPLADRNTLLTTFRQRSEIFSHGIRNAVMSQPKTRGIWGKIAKTIVKVIVSQVGIIDIIQNNARGAPRAFGSATKWNFLKNELIKTKEILEQHTGYIILMVHHKETNELSACTQPWCRLTSTNQEMERAVIKEQGYYNDLLSDLKSGVLMTMSAADRELLMSSFRENVALFSHTLSNTLKSGASRKFNWKKFIVKEIMDVIISQVDIIDMLQTNIRSAPRGLGSVGISASKLNELRADVVKAKQIVEQHTLKISDVPIKSTTFRPQAPASITGRLTISWGYENVMDKKFLLKMVAGRSLEQTMWIVKQMNPAAMSPELVKALTSRMTGQVSVRESFMDVFNSYNHIQMVANFRAQHLPQWVKDYAIAMQETVKVNLWSFYSRHSRPAGATEGQIISTIDLSEHKSKADIKVMTNKEVDIFNNVPVTGGIPFFFKSLKPTQSLRPVSEQFMQYVSGGFSPATCSVHRDQVNTLDTVSYTLPQTVTRCRTVLAMDCSADPTFAVTMIPDVMGARVLEIASLNKVVKVTLKDTVTEVKVNDQVIALDQDMAMIEQDVILRKAGRHMEIILPKVGVLVALEGDIIKIQVPKLFKSRMCGLCSNFDGQRSWEFEGPHQEVYKTQKEFALSYIVPNDVCPASMKPTNFMSIGTQGYNLFTADSELPEEGDSCIAEKRVQIKQFRKRKLICFSTEPVTECSFDCDHELTKIERKRITYKCLNRNALTQNLMRKVRRENYMVQESELEGAVKVMQRKATMETNCRA